MKNTLSFISEVLNRKPNKMSLNDLNTLTEQIRIIAAQLQASESKREELERRVETMNVRAVPNQSGLECDESDIQTNITSGDEILLESYKAIPEYSGKQHEYRSWRNQVYRRMNIINDFKAHPKYEAALAIIRAKITGAAADILTNNKTPYNIRCILKTLDAAYTDQRPLYAIEAEMVSIKQNDKNIHQYYNAINFALNAIISKVVMSYNNTNEQRSLIIEAQKKAIRTFIVGLRFRTMRHILYGQQPKTLSEAYTIAQTVFYDNEHLQLEQSSFVARAQPQQQGRACANGNKPRNEWNQPRNNDTRNGQVWNQPRNDNTCNRPTPMEVDGSNRTRQQNWYQTEQPQKREYNSSRQRFEQPLKMQKINQLMEATQQIPEDSTLDDGNNSDDSTHTNASSAFLDE